MKKTYLILAMLFCFSIYLHFAEKINVTAYETSENTYINEELGISMTAPDGWYKASDEFAQRKYLLTIFLKEAPRFNTIPAIGIGVEDVSPSLKTPLDYVKSDIEKLIQRDPNSKIIDGPKEINVGNSKGAMFIYEFTSEDNKFKCEVIAFLKGDEGITVTLMDFYDGFTNNQEDFEKAIQNFQIR